MAEEEKENLKRQVEELRNERCYICRPDDPHASKESCPDCDQKSDLNQEIKRLKTILYSTDTPEWKSAAFQKIKKIKKLETRIEAFEKELKYLKEVVPVDNATLAFYDKQAPLHIDSISSDTKMDDYVKLIPLSDYLFMRKRMKNSEKKAAHFEMKLFAAKRALEAYEKPSSSV